MSTKVSKLTHANITALRDIGAEDHGVQIAETYVVFPGDAASSLQWVQEEMDELSNRTAHPYASLHAVVRKLSAQRLSDASPATHPVDDEFRPQPGEMFQVWKGFGHDDNVFRVIEYAPVTAAPERVMKLWDLPTMPTEAVHCWRLEKVPTGRGKETRWAGVAFTAFPVDVMVDVGVVKLRASEGAPQKEVPAMTPAQTQERIGHIDDEFDIKLGALLDEHNVDDALSLPRDVWHELGRWRSDQYALAHGRDPSSREYVAGTGPARPRRAPGSGSRPSSGACEHCGLPTKGGRFTPGHDAKLKGDLGRQAMDTDETVRIPALAESAIRSRDSSKWMIVPADEDAAAVDELLLDEAPFLAERNAARSAVHKGVSDG